MDLVKDAWAGFGAAFGPVVLLALFWKRSNLAGAVTGMATGALTVIVWDYLPIVGGQLPSEATGLYSLAVGFPLALLVNVIVSLITKKPSKETTDIQKLSVAIAYFVIKGYNKGSKYPIIVKGDDSDESQDYFRQHGRPFSRAD